MRYSSKRGRQPGSHGAAASAPGIPKAAGGCPMWFILTMSLLMIAAGVGWYFSCDDASALCRTSKAFSPFPVLVGLIALGIAAFAYWEDRQRPRRRRRRRASRRRRVKLESRRPPEVARCGSY